MSLKIYIPACFGFEYIWLWSIPAFSNKEYINVIYKHPVDGVAGFDACVVRELM